MGPVHAIRPLRYRTLWLSDIHLGFRGCRAEFLLDFLHSTEAETLYLVGDIIDFWNMRRAFFWPDTHNEVVRAVLEKAKAGTQVIFVPGNHDELLRDHDGSVFGNVLIQREAVHTTADGRQLLIVHGDEFDSVVQCSPILAVLGSRAYEYLLRCNRVVNYVRRKLGFPYWSLAAYLKHKVKNAVQYISQYEDAVASTAQRRGMDGMVCGHIHRPEIRHIHDVLYCNCGDWVESCTALTERFDGSLELIHWGDEKAALIDCATAAQQAKDAAA